MWISPISNYLRCRMCRHLLSTMSTTSEFCEAGRCPTQRSPRPGARNFEGTPLYQFLAGRGGATALLPSVICTGAATAVSRSMSKYLYKSRQNRSAALRYGPGHPAESANSPSPRCCVLRKRYRDQGPQPPKLPSDCECRRFPGELFLPRRGAERSGNCQQLRHFHAEGAISAAGYQYFPIRRVWIVWSGRTEEHGFECQELLSAIDVVGYVLRGGLEALVETISERL
jgi:hypothetical protein